MTYHSETLAHEELVEITGSAWAAKQIAWLDENGWKHHARMRLAGITPQAATAEVWAPDFTGMR